MPKVRTSYHPGWGHLAALKTELVGRAIRDVKAVPIDHTGGSFLTQPPADLRLEHADIRARISRALE